MAPDSAADSTMVEGVSLEEMVATRLSVSEVIVQGAMRTRQSFLEKLVAPVVSTGGTFGGVIEDVSEAVDRIRATGVFKGTDAYLDTAAHGTTRVVFTVSERPLYQIRTGTSVRTSADRDTSVEAALVWRNLTGHADTLRASATYWGGLAPPKATNTAPSNSLAIDFSAPYVYGLKTSGFARIEQSVRAHDESGFRVRARSALAGLSTPLGTFSAIAEWREVCDISKEASVLVRNEAGHTLKAALTHEIAFEGRDDPRLPTRGFAASLTSELAGLFNMGDARFRRLDAAAQMHVPIGASGVSIALCARAGVLSNGAGPGRKACILDRFFLGGPNSLRGFTHRGVGPREAESALGGSSYYSATAMVSVPTPPVSLFHQLFGARVHVFATAGDVGEIADVRGAVASLKRGKAGLADTVKGLRESARTAVGIGIGGDTALGRIEVNLCKVLSMAPSDVPRTGVQFGLSQEFA